MNEKPFPIILAMFQLLLKEDFLRIWIFRDPIHLRYFETKINLPLNKLKGSEWSFLSD